MPKKAKEDTNKVRALNKLAKEYQGATSDTLLIYAELALEISETLSDKKGMGNSYHNIGIVHHDQRINDKSLEYYHKSLKHKKKLMV